MKTRHEIEAWLKRQLAENLGIDENEIYSDEPFINYGLNSAEAVILSGDLGRWLDRKLEPTVAWDYPDIESLARFLTQDTESSVEITATPLTQKQQGIDNSEPIAIIGIGCRFPGADGPQAFWELLKGGVDPITEVPKDRFDIDEHYDPDASKPGKLTTRWGGFLKQVDQFDPQFFGISPREAQRMDPQQRLLLEVAYESLADAGIKSDAVAGTATGVFVGISSNDYSSLQFSDPALIDAYAGTGNAHSIAANRLSYLLDLRGPSVAVDTACSSSLVSLHLACQSLRSGECSLALAGGVNLILSPNIGINFSKAGAMASDGRCKTFDSRADGYVRSEGAGVVVLKPLSQAIADQDPIYAVIRGSAVNQDGRSNGLMAPNRLAQESVIAQAFEQAGLSPAQLHYIEAHGTGTALGDPIEVHAIQNVLATAPRNNRPARIGSVKSNIGHLEAAAGIAGVIKVALSMKHRQLPANLHFEQPNPHISFHDDLLRVQTALEPWPVEEGERPIAGISSFGFGGTNAHLLLEAAPASEQADHARRNALEVFTLSAHTQAALAELAAAHADALDATSLPALYDMCFTANCRRDHLPHRLAVTGQTHTDIQQGLRSYLLSENRQGVATGFARHSKRPRLTFILPGQGAQWYGMGRELMEKEPVFREIIEQCDSLLKHHATWSLIDILQADEESTLIYDTEYTQPTLFAIQIALAALWRSYGIEPDAVIGHSMGEVAAAYIAGALTLEEAIKIIYFRGAVMKPTQGKGKMALAEISNYEAKSYLEEYSGKLSIAAVNNKSNVVLAGDPDALDELVGRLQARDVFCRFLRVDLASHSPHMEEPRIELEAALRDLLPGTAVIPIYSTVSGEVFGDSLFDSAYWGKNLREPVLFADALQQAIEDGSDLFLELSPHPTLTQVIQQELADSGKSGRVLFSLRRAEPELPWMLHTLGSLHTSGYKVDWSRLYPHGESLPLLHFPWQRNRYWLDEAAQKQFFLSQNRTTNAWETISAVGQAQSQIGPLDLDVAGYPVAANFLERFTTGYIIQYFNKVGLFSQAGETQTADSILEHGLIQHGFRKLVLRWLKRLIKAGHLTQDQDRYTAVHALPEAGIDTLCSEGARYEHNMNVLLDYMKRSGENLEGMLRGEVNPLELFFPGGSFETTEGIYQNSAIARYYNTIVARLVEKHVAMLPKDQPIHALEIGAGTGSTANSVLPQLPAHRSTYCFTDMSDLFLGRARAKFRDYPFVQYGLLNIENDPAAQGYPLHRFDIIVAANVLHATRDLNETLENVKSLLKPGGLLLVWEVTSPQTWFDITFGLIDGWSRHEDDLRDDNPLLPAEEWKRIIQANGFENMIYLPEAGAPAEVLEQHILVAMAPDDASIVADDWTDSFAEIAADTAGVSDGARNVADSDSSLLVQLATSSDEDKPQLLLSFLSERIGRILGIASLQVDVQQPMTSLGLDSLMAVEFRNQIQQHLAVTIPVAQILQGATLENMAASLAEMLRATTETAVATADDVMLLPDLQDRHEPFPLNDIQQAYWIGRHNGLELGNVSTQLYLEFESPSLDLSHLEESLNQLIKRHDMLRAIVLPTGSQQILEHVPRYQIQAIDLQGLSANEIEQCLQDKRESMSHHIRQADQWPLFDLHAHQLPGGVYRLHFSIDFLVADAASLLIMFREWSEHYRDPQLALPPLTLSFRDYVIAELKQRSSYAYKNSLSYWKQRVLDLPPAPELPLAKAPNSVKHPRFKRHSALLEKATWTSLKERAAAAGVTPSMFLCTAYAEVLRKWSKSPRFTLNLTLFNREPWHPEVKQILGDFTTLNLLQIDYHPDLGFEDRAKQIQSQLWNNMEHNRVSGVQVMRELAKSQAKGLSAAMPVVFTSVLEDFSPNFNWLGDLVYSISQTPQVWLDHQVLEKDGTLFLVWDGLDEIFPAGMLEDMFKTYVELLHQLSEQPKLWQANALPLLPSNHQDVWVQYNNTDATVPEQLLQDGFLKQASLTPERPAVITGTKTLTYEELRQRSNAIAHQLRDLGVTPGNIVAVVMEKGWEQVVAAFGILQAGGAYLPIDAKFPDERIHYLLANTDARIVLTQSHIQPQHEWPAGVKTICVDEQTATATAPLSSVQQPSDLAYVIFTSGSTGLPKGVMIDHRGAWNTIDDINNRFTISESDRVLALSSMNFDLSVYDFFGPLAIGGAIVLPEPDAIQNPLRWAELMREHDVTVLNSVPALTQLLVDTVEDREDLIPASLRLILMSGDWIPTTLPDRLHAMNSNMDVISLGGATEASIWSILHPITEVSSKWKSIPYGKPMLNQRFYVLDDALEPCPLWVPGHLYIGGVGVALGYWRDEEKNREKFITHKVTGERLYRTGDLGRINGDSHWIEFLGREDFQVKIHGYRVELGEIEAALQAHDAIKEAAVLALGEQNEMHLVAYVIAASDALNEQAIKTYLLSKLPSYMVPATYVFLPSMPLSSNGKVDRKALPEPDMALEKEKAYEKPETDLEIRIAQVWAETIGITQVGRHEDFFHLGGNSLLSIQAVVKLQKEGLPVTAQQIFENPTVAQLAAALDLSHDERTTSNVQTAEQEPSTAPTIREADEVLPSGDVVPLKHAFVTGATGYLGFYLVWELLLETQAVVHCLVRATNQEEARNRLVETFRWYLPEEDFDTWSDRINPVLGSIDAPALGIDPSVYEDLSNKVDIIYHSAAEVRHIGEIEHFNNVNVRGTEAIIAFAQHGRIKSLQHLSTVGVRGINPEITDFTEDDFDRNQEFDTPYARSKWEAEKVVRSAIKAGLPATIHRLGFVAAHSENGRFQRNIDGNALYQYIKSTLEMGVAPYIPELELDFTPVDFFAKAIVTVSQTTIARGLTTHLLNPNPVRHYDLMRVLQALGYPILLLDFDEYLNIVFSLRDDAEYQAQLAGIVGFLDVNRARILQMNSTKTQQLLANLGLTYPAVSPEWIQKLAAHCIEVGYWKAPAYWGKTKHVPALL